MTKMSHDKRCGSYFVTYLVGRLLPRSPHVSLPPRFAPSSEHEPAHIPLAGVARILARVLAGGVGDRAHIPQTRGGAHGQFLVCS
jgi:hypothetical protein